MSSDEENTFEGPKRRVQASNKYGLHEDGFDDRGYGDDKDREYLCNLTHLERETIIGERLAKREESLRKRDLLKHATERTNEMERKRDEMSRMKQERIERKRPQKDLEANYSDYKEPEREDSDYEDLPRKKLSIRASRAEPELGAGLPREGEEDQYREIIDTDLELVNTICLARNFLVANSAHLYLKKTIEHCLVRISVKTGEKSENYVAEIVDVVEKPEAYKIDNKEVNKYLMVRYENEIKEMMMTFISNKKMTSHELFNYIKTLKKNSMRVPMVGDIRRTFLSLTNMLKSKFTAKDIEQIVEQKNKEKMKSSAPAQEKLRILTEDYGRLSKTFFEKPTPEMKQRLKNMEKEMVRIRAEIEQRAIEMREQPIVNVTKSNPYNFHSTEPKTGESIMHTRTIPKLLNMWSEHIKIDERVLGGSGVVEKGQVEEKVEDNMEREKGLCRMNEEVKEDFLRSYQIELPIDWLIDQKMKAFQASKA